MLGSVDAIMRPLKIPPRFVTYMEKHRIYDLFHELATRLIIQQPSDHIVYLKQSLRLAAKKRDLPRIIFLGKAHSEILGLAKLLQKKLSLIPITLSDIQNVTNDTPEESMTEQDIVSNLILILKKLAADYSGWILVDLPRTKNEARAIQRAGITPTHVLEIVNSSTNPDEKTFECEDNLRDLREVYKDFLIDIKTGERNDDELAEACAILAKRKKHCGAPCLFRVALIGSRGSGCESLAKYLSQRFNLIHGKSRKQYIYLPNVNEGWGQNGHHEKIVIFVNVDKPTLRERLLCRRYNVIAGSKNNLHSADNVDFHDEKEFFTRQKDFNKVVEADIEEYEKNVDCLISYVGESGTIVDGNTDERIVRERIEACLVRPAPCAPPRVSKSSRKIIDPIVIEFEPDDDPDHRILDQIRETETLLSLI